MSSYKNTHHDLKDSPFTVLGIALVVDQKHGLGARLVMRYPTMPPAKTKDAAAAEEKKEYDEDLFFRLPSQQMAKLFRPKPALCGQPMTLCIGKTIFCCCAMSMENNNNNNNISNHGSNTVNVKSATADTNDKTNEQDSDKDISNSDAIKDESTSHVTDEVVNMVTDVNNSQATNKDAPSTTVFDLKDVISKGTVPEDTTIIEGGSITDIMDDNDELQGSSFVPESDASTDFVMIDNKLDDNEEAQTEIKSDDGMNNVDDSQYAGDDDKNKTTNDDIDIIPDDIVKTQEQENNLVSEQGVERVDTITTPNATDNVNQDDIIVPNDETVKAVDELDANAPIKDLNDNKPNCTNESDLVLFSVIVALIPREGSATTTITGWYDSNNPLSSNATTDGRPRSGSLKYNQVQPKSGGSNPNLHENFFTLIEGRQASASFLSMQRVHVSLSRLCRVLAREERQCRYVSLQAHHFRKVRYNYLSSLIDKRNISTCSSIHNESDSHSNDQSNFPSTHSFIESSIRAIAPALSSMSTTPAASGTPSSVTIPNKKKQHHRKKSSFSVISMDRDVPRIPPTERIVPPENVAQPPTNTDEDEIAPSLEQEIVEVLLVSNYQPSVPISDDNEGNTPVIGQNIKGNMASELVQTFHALSRKDYSFPPTPRTLLTNRENVIYVNQRLPIFIESVAPTRAYTLGETVHVASYHTLFFPHASPKQLIDSLSSSGTVVPRPLKKLLILSNPQKSIAETATDARLTIESIMEAATHLVRRGACKVGYAVSRNNRLALIQTDLTDHALSFAQTFGMHVNLFMLISFLTDSDITLGEALTSIVESNNFSAVLLRQHMLTTLQSNQKLHDVKQVNDAISKLPTPIAQNRLRRQRANDLVELLFQMTIWLISHQIVVQMQEYLLAVSVNSDGPIEDHVAEGEKKSNVSMNYDDREDQDIYSELQSCNCLGGDCSLLFIAWKTGLDVHRIRTLGNRHPRLRVVTRVPRP